QPLILRPRRAAPLFVPARRVHVRPRPRRWVRRTRSWKDSKRRARAGARRPTTCPKRRWGLRFAFAVSLRTRNVNPRDRNRVLPSAGAELVADELPGQPQRLAEPGRLLAAGLGEVLGPAALAADHPGHLADQLARLQTLAVQVVRHRRQ